MTSSEASVPVPPEHLRPGQFGVLLLGRVAMGDIAATLADLCVRDFMQVEQIPDAGAGRQWSVRLRRRPAGRADGSLLRYEETLLNGLPRHGEACTLSSLGGQATRLLDATRVAVVHESVHRGWLRRLDHHQRTAEGDELAGRVRGFQRQLRHFVSGPGSQGMPDELLPYALRFGLLARDDAPLVQFAHAWVEAFGSLPGWRPPEYHRPEPDIDSGPLLSNDDEMSRQIMNAAFLL